MGEDRVAEAVLACVALIPRGQVMTYGDVAEYCGLPSARMVGRVLASNNDPEVPWHRVLRADGSCADHVAARQVPLLRAEAVPFRGARVDLAAARWDGQLA